MEYIEFILSYFISLFIGLLRKNVPNKIEQILLVRLDHLGDLACTLEAIKNIRIKYKNSKITLLTGEWNAVLFIDKYLIDEVIIYNSPKFTRDRTKITDIRKRFEIYKNLRKRNYSIIIGFRDDFFTLIISLLLFPKIRIDRGTVRFKFKLSQIYNSKIRGIHKPVLHEIDTNKLIICTLIEKYIKSNDLFYFSSKEKAWLVSFLELNKLTRNNYAVFHTGASWKYRMWSTEKFAEVAEHLYQKFNLKILIIGSTDEIKIGEILENNNTDIFINLVGKTKLRELLLLLDAAKIVVCNDSGPMHLSSVMGKLTFALLGPQEIERFGPKGDSVVYFHKKVECYPCKQIICKHPELPCVNLNTPDEIIKKIDDELLL